MCGRIDVDGEEINRWVPQDLGIRFKAASNHDLRPAQTVSTVASVEGRLQQLDTRWGIKPKWATSLLINAKSETVTEKQTFVKAFAFNRCLVPCSGFYEWMSTKAGKVKLRFHRIDERPLYMAAFWYEGETPQLVTLTRAAPTELYHIHNRFPVFIGASEASTWLNATPLDAQAMAIDSAAQGITFSPSE
ncbi:MULTISPECIES: SOS response-associated peptidase [unclassified Marinimicrobium]|jgi:putative SOS response-associated peptidase YedK|uniref:SOS response-associated peptidase n=1 Tax=unclassified Marinimicrobium TaxID=2632100 RepID=UPI000C3A8BE1|nr:MULTISPECIES: SOS response-associated peptidase family protein [unclassified Marinimicrobium]MAN51227.1 DUF159 family protein [Marinimicrobium sp.]|tara:strand:+ start:1676 stop:2245 length:570 start_codon:yes stop_codon:yes gene_type:complete